MGRADTKLFEKMLYASRMLGIIDELRMVGHAGMMDELPALGRGGIDKGSISTAPISPSLGIRSICSIIDKLPMDDVGFHNVVTDLPHKRGIGLSSIMVPARNIKQVGSLKRSGLVRGGVSTFITNHVSNGSDAFVHMCLLGMALDPTNTDSARPFSTHSSTKV